MPQSMTARRSAPSDREALIDRIVTTRRRTLMLAASLSAEDQAIQSMSDASPTKWHLAHTTWFFETFVLRKFARDYAPFDERYGYLFNSYYEAEGPRHPRPARGMLSRPGLDEIHAYRAQVDAAIDALADLNDEEWRGLSPFLELGLAHEEQHQELILMDAKHLLSLNPLRPGFGARRRGDTCRAPPLEWLSFAVGVYEIGADGVGFSYDNERPRHRVFLEPFRLANRLVSNADYEAFIDDGGYRRPEFWLADGWTVIHEKGWTAPLYWSGDPGSRSEFSLSGERALDPDEPVVHVSYYEADAFARWAGKRLPREPEWEVAASRLPVEGHFASTGEFHPRPADGAELSQMFGDAWEWTSSAYDAYPGFRSADGALGEYNAKFMCGQYVLRGGSAVTPEGHIRATYRNYYPPAARWAFSGIRLADDDA